MTPERQATSKQTNYQVSMSNFPSMYLRAAPDQHRWTRLFLGANNASFLGELTPLLGEITPPSWGK